MKREDLKALGLTDEQIEKVMGFHGTTVNDINGRLAAATTAASDQKAQLDKLTADLAAAQKATGDADAIKKQLAEVQAALANTQKAQKVRDALAEYKPHDAETILRLIDLDKVSFGDAGIAGLKEQMEPLKASKKFLFADTPDGAGGKPPADPNPNKPTTTVADELKSRLFPTKNE